jgi:hypothetical protein
VRGYALPHEVQQTHRVAPQPAVPHRPRGQPVEQPDVPDDLASTPRGHALALLLGREVDLSVHKKIETKKNRDEKKNGDEKKIDTKKKDEKKDEKKSRRKKNQFAGQFKF